MLDSNGKPLESHKYGMFHLICLAVLRNSARTESAVFASRELLAAVR